MSTGADEDNGAEFDLRYSSMSETARSVVIVDRPAVTITTVFDASAWMYSAPSAGSSIANTRTT